MQNLVTATAAEINLGSRLPKLPKSLTSGNICLRCGDIEEVCDCNNNRHNLKLRILAPRSELHNSSLVELRGREPYATRIKKSTSKVETKLEDDF